MVPSGGLRPAKMAPAGAQMGSGNPINAGIEKKGGREAEKRGGGKQSRQGGTSASRSWRTDGWTNGRMEVKTRAGPRVRLKSRSSFNSLSREGGGKRSAGRCVGSEKPRHRL